MVPRILNPRWALAGITAVVIVLILWLAYRPTTAALPQPSPPTPQQSTINALGRLEPEGEVIALAAPTFQEGARVAELKVKAGDWVRRGQVVAVLDRRERLTATLQEAQAHVREAQAQLAKVQVGAKQGDLVAQQATIVRLERERQLAKVEFERFQALNNQGAISDSLLDSKMQTVINLQGQLAQAQATLESLQEIRPTDVEAAEAAVATAKKAQARAQADLDVAYVRALQAGQVLKIRTWPGEVITNQPIVEMGKTDHMNAVAEVYETDVSKIQLGQLATVTSVNGGFAETLHGQVIEIGHLIGKKDVLSTDPAADIDARVIEVKVRLYPKDSQRVQNLTHLQIEVAFAIDQKLSSLPRPTP